MITTLLKRNCFLFAQTRSWNLKLYKPHFEQYFDKDVTKIQQPIKQLVKKYSVSKKKVQKLFRNKPQVFIQDSPERAELEQKVQFLNKLQQQEPIAGVLNELLFDSRHLLYSMNPQQISLFIKQLKDFGFDKEQSEKVFTKTTNLIHCNFDLLYKQRLDIFKDYLQMSEKQVVQLIVNQPFLLTCSAKRLRESVIFFIQHQGDILTRRKTINLLNTLGEIFLLGREELSMLFRWLRDWGFSSNRLWKILLKNPLILLNHPGQIFNYKAKMFRQFRFTTAMAKRMLEKYPQTLICSVGALEAKFLIARDRLKITINEDNLEFLTFKFGSNIRPRSEMLIRGKVPYTSEDIVSFFNCTDKQFVEKTGIPADKLKEEKAKFKITAELDFPNKKCLKNYPSSQKIFDLSKKYYPLDYPVVNQESKSQKKS